MSGSVQADMSSDLLTEGCLEYSDLVLMSFGPHLGPVPLLAWLEAANLMQERCES